MEHFSSAKPTLPNYRDPRLRGPNVYPDHRPSVSLDLAQQWALNPYHPQDSRSSARIPPVDHPPSLGVAVYPDGQYHPVWTDGDYQQGISGGHPGPSSHTQLYGPHMQSEAVYQPSSSYFNVPRPTFPPSAPRGDDNIYTRQLQSQQDSTPLHSQQQPVCFPTAQAHNQLPLSVQYSKQTGLYTFPQESFQESLVFRTDNSRLLESQYATHEDHGSYDGQQYRDEGNTVYSYDATSQRQLDPGHHQVTMDPAWNQQGPSDEIAPVPHTSDVIHEELDNPFLSHHPTMVFGNSDITQANGFGEEYGKRAACPVRRV